DESSEMPLRRGLTLPATTHRQARSFWIFIFWCAEFRNPASGTRKFCGYVRLFPATDGGVFGDIRHRRINRIPCNKALGLDDVPSRPGVFLFCSFESSNGGHGRNCLSDSPSPHGHNSTDRLY